MMRSKTEAIAVFGAGLIKDGEKWRTAHFDEKDNFASLGDRVRSVAASYLCARRKESGQDFIIIVLGGRGQFKDVPDAPTCAEVLYDELTELGVDQNLILKEEKSGNTYQQLVELENLVIEKNLGQVDIISNEYHLPRIRAMIECASGLENLKSKLSDQNLNLLSAEKIVIDHDSGHWHSVIESAYKSRGMRERIKLEKRGVAQIKLGTYKFQ